MDKAQKFVLIPFRDFRLLTCKRKINSKGRISGIVKEFDLSDDEDETKISKATQRFDSNVYLTLSVFRTAIKKRTNHKGSNKKPVTKKRRTASSDEESTKKKSAESEPTESENQSEPTEDSNESEETE